MGIWTSDAYKTISISTNAGDSSEDLTLKQFVESATSVGTDTFTVINNLINCSNTCPVTTIGQGCDYEASIIPDALYKILRQNITLKINGQDVTDSYVEIIEETSPSGDPGLVYALNNTSTKVSDVLSVGDLAKSVAVDNIEYDINIEEV